MTFHLTPVSNNKKVGPIPVSTSSRETCPDRCVLKGNGCYAENYPLSYHWKAVTSGKRGVDFDSFLEQIRQLKQDTFWRYAQAGDLPGKGDILDREALRRLVEANTGLKGFTYTHKPLTARNFQAIREANRDGFTINISTHSLHECDRVMRLGLPAVVTVPDDHRPRKTPEGRPVIVCPAQLSDSVTCDSCRLCAKPDRKYPIAFLAHGARKRLIQISA